VLLFLAAKRGLVPSRANPPPNKKNLVALESCQLLLHNLRSGVLFNGYLMANGERRKKELATSQMITHCGLPFEKHDTINTPIPEKNRKLHASEA